MSGSSRQLSLKKGAHRDAMRAASQLPEMGPPMDPTPLKNHKGSFHMHTGPDPMKNHKATQPTFKSGPSSTSQPRSVTPFKWCFVGHFN